MICHECNGTGKWGSGAKDCPLCGEIMRRHTRKGVGG
jgi:rubrerythrin